MIDMKFEILTLEEQAIRCLEDNCFTDDEELTHVYADEILCEALNKLGYTRLAEQIETVGKWYA